MEVVLNTNVSEKRAEIRRGDEVLVRVFGGNVVPRKVWACDVGVVYICADQVYSALASGQPGPPATAFPLADVLDPVTRQPIGS